MHLARQTDAFRRTELMRKFCRSRLYHRKHPMRILDFRFRDMSIQESLVGNRSAAQDCAVFCVHHDNTDGCGSKINSHDTHNRVLRFLNPVRRSGGFRTVLPSLFQNLRPTGP